MTSFLDDLPLMEHGDFVAELAGGKTVRNIDGSPVASDVIELAVDFGFGNGIEGGGGFVENDEGRILIKSAGKSDLLGFAAGDVDTFGVVILIEIGIQLVGKSVKTVSKAGFDEAIGHQIGIIITSRCYILTQLQCEQAEVLKDHREDHHIVEVVIFADVNTVQEDNSLGGIVEAAQKLDEGGLTRAVHAHHGQSTANLEFHIDMTEGILLASRIFEGHVAEFHFVVVVAALFYSKGALVHIVRNIQKFKY